MYSTPTLTLAPAQLRLQIDPATNNIVQNVYIFETIKLDAGMSYRLLDTRGQVRDAPNGCVMPE